jgi:transposase
MGRKVRSYTQEYKNTIVDLFNSGKTYADLSDEYGVPKTTIRQWVNKANNTANNTTSNENHDDIKAIKKRMAKLEQENEILHQRRAEPKKPSPYSQQQNRRNL